MTATTKPAPATAAAVLEAVVRAVGEGRYRYARLHLVWARHSGTFESVVALVDQASAAPELPPGLDPAAIVERGRPRYVPSWLEEPLAEEIRRICVGAPLERSDENEVVARVAAAVCIDVAADLAGAANRLHSEGTGQAVPARARMMGAEHVIDLGAESGAGSRSAPSAPSF